MARTIVTRSGIVVKKARKTKRSAPRSKREQVKLIKKVMKGEAETKIQMYYGNNNPSTAPFGVSTQQNQFIISNTTDILRILPEVSGGVNDDQRVGSSITPVSCVTHCSVTISANTAGGSGFANNLSYNLVAVAYCLQHVSYKTYASLSTQNNFAQMLKLGVGGQTSNFNGTFEFSKLPVEKGYYQVLGKKTFNLRNSGVQSTTVGVPQAQWGTNANAAPVRHEWTWNLTKQLPKKIQYPEANSAAPGLDDPLNAAPFWCIGYYQMDGSQSVTAPQVLIQQQYVTVFKYKDV